MSTTDCLYEFAPYNVRKAFQHLRISIRRLPSGDACSGIILCFCLMWGSKLEKRRTVWLLRNTLFIICLALLAGHCHCRHRRLRPTFLFLIMNNILTQPVSLTIIFNFFRLCQYIIQNEDMLPGCIICICTQGGMHGPRNVLPR